MESNYVSSLVSQGVQAKDVIAMSLAYNEVGKATVSFIKEYLNKLMKALEVVKTKYILVTDSAYFKVLTNQRKAEPHLGYALPCAIKGYEHMTVVLGINYQQLIYDPKVKEKLDLGLNALASVVQGTYQEPGGSIIHSAHYPSTYEGIKIALIDLLKHPKLSCDIEGFSLSFDRAGIGTIAFAWNQHEGVAFACDYYAEILESGYQVSEGSFVPQKGIRELLRQFFENYTGELTFHHAPYDTKCMIYALWMKDLKDTEGLLKGLDVLTRNMHDTKIISYLALNSTAGNQLSLKSLAQEFAGNWAVEVHDIRKVKLSELLQYNLVDALCTNYVRDKYEPIMEADNQGDLYRGLFLDSLKLIIQLELTGMPMSRSRIQAVKQQLEDIQDDQMKIILGNGVIKVMNLIIQEAKWETDFTSRRDKAKNPEKIKPKAKDHFANEVFNPNSGPQLQKLLYEQMGLPVIDLTESKAPATGADTLEKLINHTSNDSYKELLKALIAYGKVTKILSTFIPAFEGAISKDGSDIVWLHGCFNLGGTVSGRLSSSDPNLQNIPANSLYGKLIKSCFVNPTDWLFCGADFNSLEDYISALTTKDPNKLKVYEKGFDGHCLRAAYYYRDKLIHIDLEDPKSVNTIKKDWPELRQESKTPTFALTYQGTFITLMNNLGWSEQKAKQIEASYHEMYKVSDEYVQSRLKQANKDGYVEVAFGLRVRTPLIKQVIWNSSKMPYEAAAEGRTAGNALGQSYGLLNNRAAVEFFKKVWASKYRTDILPVALIHDAIYILVKDDVEVMEFANRELINAMRWQDLPEIQHPTVKLGAALDIFYPSWENAITLPNDADQSLIRETCNKGKEKWLEKNAPSLAVS